MEVTAVVPLKGFALSKQRLAGGISDLGRNRLAAAAAEHVVDTCVTAGVATRIVTSDPEVTAMAHRLGAEAMSDPGKGLNGAVRAGVTGAKGWLVVHGDLPLLDTETVEGMARRVSIGEFVLAPSRDGGTNLLGGHGDFPFAYGPGSFHRHVGRLAGRPLRIIISAVTAIEIDTPADLAAASRLDAGAWLDEFLS